MELAFETLKLELAKEVKLAFPDYSPEANPLELYTDASKVGAGACLIQRQNGEARPIAYSSVAFSPTQQNFSQPNSK